MRERSHWKPKFHSRLNVEQLEERTLPNAIFQIVGTSLLGPTFALLNDTQPPCQVRLVNEAPAEKTTLSVNDPGLELSPTMTPDYAFLGRANFPGEISGSTGELNSPAGRAAAADAFERHSHLLTLPGSDNLFTLGIPGGQSDGTAGQGMPTSVGSGGGAGGQNGGTGGGVAAAASSSFPGAPSGVQVSNVNQVPPGTPNSLGQLISAVQTSGTRPPGAVQIPARDPHPGPVPLTSTQSAGRSPSAPRLQITSAADPSSGLTLTINGSTDSAYLPVNADNDNGSAVTDGIPAVRDFDATQLSSPDPDLLPASVTLPSGTTPDGDLMFFVNGQETSNTVRFWLDQQKTTNIPWEIGAFDQTVWEQMLNNGFYIEGIHESGAQGDTTIQVAYQDEETGFSGTSNAVTVTVTPVPVSFIVSPANRQNINFVDQSPVDGLKGLQATALNPSAPGATFDAQVQRTGAQGRLHFIQNVTDVENGVNGDPAGWMYTPASNFANKNALPVGNSSFPFLDTSGTALYYELHNKYTTDTADFQELTDDDAPGTNVPAGLDPSFTAVIDVRVDFELYAVWTYPSGVIYPLLHLSWSANFWADTNVAGKGVTVIKSPNGVSAEPWETDNSPPGAMEGPYFNQSVSWRGAI